MAGAGRTGHGVRAGSVTFSPQGLRAGSTMRLCAAGAALFAVGHVRGGRQRPSLPCGLRAPSNGTPPDADTNSVSAVPTTAARNAARPFTVSRVLARRLALPALFVLAAAYHVLAVARTRHADGLRRRAPLRRSSPSPSPPGTASRSAASRLLPRSTRAARSIAGLAPELDDDAYTAAKILNAAVMSAAVFPTYWLARRIVRPSFALLTAAAAVADAGDGLPRVPHVRGARVPGLPRDGRRAREGARGTLTPDGDRGARGQPRRSRDTRPVPVLPSSMSPQSLCAAAGLPAPRTARGARLAPRRRSSASRARSARTAAQRTCVRRSARLRTGRS